MHKRLERTAEQSMPFSLKPLFMRLFGVGSKFVAYLRLNLSKSLFFSFSTRRLPPLPYTKKQPYRGQIEPKFLAQAVHKIPVVREVHGIRIINEADERGRLYRYLRAVEEFDSSSAMQ
jgi:hypothetical protein